MAWWTVRAALDGDQGETPPAMTRENAGRSAEKPAGIQEDWRNRLPSIMAGPVGQAQAFAGAAGFWLRDLFTEPAPIGDARDSANRAAITWQAIERTYSIRGQEGALSSFSKQRGHVSASWGLGQGIAAALDIAELNGDWSDVNSMFRFLSSYRSPDPAGGVSYSAGVFTGTGAEHYWDDNAWIGLDFMQAFAMTGDRRYLEAAENMVPYMRSGIAPDGGVYWKRNAEVMTRNTCSTAPTEQMFLRLFEATGNTSYLEDAERMRKFRVEGPLATPEGLYLDNVNESGQVDRAVYTYNQGTPIGADLLWFRITGDPTHLERAKKTAAATLEKFGKDDGFFRHSPVFNAIFFRNLLHLDSVAPDPAYRRVLDQYLEKVWTQARNPENGLFEMGGIGEYGSNEGEGANVIDQAGIVQLYTLLNWPKDRLKNVG